MDIKITHQSLKKFIDTAASAEEIAAKVSLCGPTFDRIHKTNDDYIFEIEVITNRIDSVGVQGIARETVAILNQFDMPSKMINDPYKSEVNLYSNLPQVFKIDFEDSTLSPRFVAISMSDVKVSTSPSETVDFLEKCGERAINNLVDITNEITLLYGMPCHVFDLDKISQKYLFVRKSKSKETITTLDGSDCVLHGDDIVIEDADKQVIDLCGIMGGSIASVDNQTTNILLIVPIYDPKRIRKTSLYLQKRTLAAQIYEKRPDSQLCLPVINAAIDLFTQRAGAKVSSKIYDYFPDKLTPKNIDLNLDWLNQFIGKNIEPERIITILDDLGFGGSLNGQTLTCTVPSYRYYDINIKEDIAEEVARIYGYFRLPAILPSTRLTAQEPDPILVNELKTKKFLANIGCSEVFNNSLISQELIIKSESQETNYLKLNNALSSEYEYLRISLIPSLLANLKNNLGKNPKPINIFELSNVYLKRQKGKIPDEVSHLGLISNESYLKTKGSLESLFDHLNITSYTFSKVSKTQNKIFDINKTAEVKSEGQILGYIGVVNPKITNNFGITSDTFVAELDFTKIVANINKNYVFKPVSEYPNVIQDVTISSNLLVGEIIQSVKQVSSLIDSVEYVTTYKNNHTFRITFSSLTNNLDQKTVSVIRDEIISKFK